MGAPGVQVPKYRSIRAQTLYILVSCDLSEPYWVCSLCLDPQIYAANRSLQDLGHDRTYFQSPGWSPRHPPNCPKVGLVHVLSRISTWSPSWTIKVCNTLNGLQKQSQRPSVYIPVANFGVQVVSGSLWSSKEFAGPLCLALRASSAQRAGSPLAPRTRGESLVLP